MKQDMIVILDLGSHENTVLARAIRALGVYSEIYPHDITVEELKALPNVKGIIINGGPNNVIDGVAIDVNPGIYEMGTPVMAAGHDKALCEVKLPEFTDDVEAIKGAVKSFVFDTCKAEANWNMTNFVNDQVELIRRQVGDRKVLLALSGGVDSSVVAALLLKAIGDKLVCVHVNHGLMRKGESEAVVEIFGKELKANLIYVDATDRFLSKLENVADPEEKRKIIGGEFIRVFEEEARKLDGIDWRRHNLLSLAGIYQPKKVLAESKLPVALTRFLEDHPSVKTIYLHLDNDGPGRLATKAIMAVIPKEYEVKNRPPPTGKDVNDTLCHRLGIPIRGSHGKEPER